MIYKVELSDNELMMMIMMRMMMLAHGWRPPHVGRWAQRDTVLKLIVIYSAVIQS